MPACKTMAGFINCFALVFYVYLTKLHRNVYILSTEGVIFVGRLVCSVNVLYMELSYTGSLDQSTRASEHVTVQISLPTVEDKIKCRFCYRSTVVQRRFRIS